MYAATDIEKHYGGITALRGVDLEVLPGEVHALVGANGAGKSTLVKILAGSERPSAGRILLDDEEVRFAHQRQAVEHGVAIVSQELNLFPDLSVLHNLFLPAEPRRGPVIAWGEMRARAEPVCEEIGLHVDLDRPVGRLRLGERQLVEVARALLRDPKVLILDEPTSALETEESLRLLDVVRRLRDRGVAVIFVTHFLEDVFALADRITVVRDGRITVAGAPRESMTMAGVVREMLGDLPARDAEARERHRHELRPGGVTLEGVSIRGQLDDVSLEARCGEIVGLAGLEGSGARRVFDVLFGLTAPARGRVTLPGGAGRPTSPAQAVRAGVAFVPADRKGLGVMLATSIAVNVTQVSGSVLGRLGPLLRRGAMEQRSERWSGVLGVKASGPASLVGQLSGGNQQKVVFAKWLDAEPQTYLLDDPTRGVDIGAKEEMHEIILSLAAEGRVVLMASSELEELVKVCDRVVVFFHGRVAGELRGAALHEHGLLEAINTGVV